MKNQVLILDVGGVLATNLTPKLWQQLASIGQCDEASLYAAYKQEVSKSLWCGIVDESYFWSWLSARGITLEDSEKQKLISNCLRPLPAIQHLERWSKRCSIAILSNHRSEWLQPLLKPYLPYLQAVYVSDQAGRSKPDHEWFQEIHQPFIHAESILFVDDSINNLQAAQQCGWSTLLADEYGLWTIAIDEWLH